jgi:hypothetical protein
MFFQYLATFGQCRIGVLVNGCTDFLFVPCQFGFVMRGANFGSNVSGFSSLLEKTIQPRPADRKMLGNIFDGIAVIIVAKCSFA